MTDHFKVSSHRPIPGHRNRYPWKVLQVNESFLFRPGTSGASAHTQCRQATHYNQPKTFRAGKVEEAGVLRFYAIRVE